MSGTSAEATRGAVAVDAAVKAEADADPTGADRTGIDLAGADPAGADPAGADPTGTDPAGAVRSRRTRWPADSSSSKGGSVSGTAVNVIVGAMIRGVRRAGVGGLATAVVMSVSVRPVGGRVRCC